MADYQQIVDRIRGFVTAADQTNSPDLPDLAIEYAALCNEANTRLRRCTDLIHRGLHAEAIHLADEHPLLMDVMTVLDFPELAQWATICATYALTRPPRLLIEAAQELNDAYALAQPAEALLDQLRTMALARAPLADRIAVMRSIAKTDTASTFWDDDIKGFEQVRLRELKTDAVRAIEKKDLPQLARLIAELDAPDWRLSPPPELRAALHRTEVAARQEEVAAQIRALLPELEVAFGAMNFNDVTASLMKIRSLAAQNKMSLPPDVATQLQPIEHWVAQQNALVAAQQQFAEVCDALSVGIAQHAPIPRLESLENDAQALGDLPEELANRLRNEINRQRSRQRAKSLMRVVAIAAGVLVVAGVGVLVQRQMSRNSHGEEVAAKLGAMIDSGTPDDLDDADQYLKQVSAQTPYVLDRSDIKADIDKLTAAKETDKERRAAAAADLAAAKARVDSAIAENTSAAAAWNGVNDLIDAAARSARTGSEKTAVNDLRDRASAARTKNVAAEEERLQQSLAGLSDKTASVRAAVDAGRGAVKTETLATLIRQASDLRNSAEAAGLDPTRAQAQSLADQLTSLQSTLESQDREAAELDTVKQSAGSSESLAKALVTFAQKCPGSVHARPFANAAGNAAMWDTVEAAAQMTNAWGGDFKPNVSDLPQRTKEVAQYLGSYPISPWRPVFEEYQAYLETWEKAVAEDSPWKKDFRDLLTYPLLKDRMCCEGVDGRFYYLPPDQMPVNTTAGTTVPYMTSSAYILNGDVKELKTLTFQSNQLRGGAQVSPQSELSAELDKQAESLVGEWEDFGYTVSFKIAGAGRVDPVLRVMLLNRVCKFAKTTTYRGGQVFDKLAGELDPLNADEINWMNPDDDVVAAKRDVARQLLEKVDDLKPARDMVLARRDALFKQLRIGVVGTGLLLKENAGWTVNTSVSATPGRSVFAISSKRGWFQIGVAQDGSFVISPESFGSEANAFDGSMVFVVDTPK